MTDEKPTCGACNKELAPGDVLGICEACRLAANVDLCEEAGPVGSPASDTLGGGESNTPLAPLSDDEMLAVERGESELVTAYCAGYMLRAEAWPRILATFRQLKEKYDRVCAENDDLRKPVQEQLP